MHSKKIERLGIFIDEANIYHSQKTLGWKVDYIKLKKYFENIGQITVLNFYTSFLEENGPQNKRFEKLSKNGFKIIKKKLKFIKNNGAVIKKGNLDIELALDSYKNKDKYTTYILFSGDSDFECLMRELKKENKTLHTYSTKEHVSRELINCSDRYFDMKKLKDIFSR